VTNDGGRGWGSRRFAVAVCSATVALTILLAVPALADFGDPGTDPSESPRLNTPDDLEFDRCETDDEDTPQQECGSYFNEEYGSFGFSPDSAIEPGLPPLGGDRTNYDNCAQLDAQGREANLDAGDPECSQLSGVRADTAWKYSTGDPDTSIAILDTGIRWQSEELVEKVDLNEDELPVPEIGGPPLMEDADCGDYLEPDQRGDPHDANDDGGVSVRDYACDDRVAVDRGDTESDDLLDASDLIATFSEDLDGDGDPDDDGNGYADDIAGWDFFDDDNDPFDASSCCSASGHGTGRAAEAAAETNNGEGGTGMCPDCQIMPLRIWDTFVADTNLFSLGLTYAADNGADVAEGAVGGLLNSRFARSAFVYADRQGLALTMVSSDINSANHNYPTNYNEAIYVGGSLPDSAPADCDIPSPPVIGDFLPVPDFGAEQCLQFFEFLSDRTGQTTPPSTQPPTTSFFRNSNLTQYGGKADIVLMGSTGSENTGQASGAAGLLASYGREELGGPPLSGNEIRQLLTMTAEDVMPENTGQIGLPDRAEDGWDTHFGYGRVNLAGAMDRIQEGRIPPEAQIDGPDWFAPINVDRVGPAGVPVQGRVAAPHGEVGSWELEYACGQDALDSAFQPVPGASGNGERDGLLGLLPRSILVNLANTCDGSVQNDAGRPAGRAADPGDPAAWPANPYPSPDPERHAFQIRLTVHEAGDPTNFGRYRKTLFAYQDDGNRPGWPKPIGSGSRPSQLITASGGETPPRLADLDGDNRLDVLLGNSSGELHVLDQDGRPLESFNGGEPVLTEDYPAAAHETPADEAGLQDPREPFRTPAIGDLDGDGEPEIVATAGERVYAWDRHGRVVPGFPARIDPALSEPCIGGPDAKPCFDAEDRAITPEHHIKRGFISSPALADLDDDGRLDIVAGSLDQHLYAFDENGDAVATFNGGEPVELDDGDPATGAEIATSPAIANLDGDEADGPEIVIATNEVVPGDFAVPRDPGGILDAFVKGALGANLVYAVGSNGELEGGSWPAEIGTLDGDILPLVVPGNDAAVLDADDNPDDDEVAIAAATGDAKLVDGDGSDIRTFNNDVSATNTNVLDRSMIINLADYPVVGELADDLGASVIKNGISLNGVANLLAVNQNLPFNHVVQAWDPRTGQYQPQYPVATDDFQLVSQSAVAKVGGLAQERQALVGTGLYQLHAYGPAGSEPGGWPKFLGGWVQPTPSVGDVDGDGELEVSAVTREGWSFVWNTGADACQAGSTTTNQEWWTFHHDEFSTANYETDSRPPSRPGPLDVTRGADDDRVLSFEASGDDLACGAPERYEARGSDQPIVSGSDFQNADLLEVRAAQIRSGGQRQTLTVEGAGDFHFVAIRAVDDADNVGYVRAAPVPTGPGPGPGPGPGTRARCFGQRATMAGSRRDDTLRGGPGRDVIQAQ